MCGIAGLVSRDGLAPDARARAIAMRDVLVHRGPDEAGLHGDRHAVLAHRRLSIVDLTPASSRCRTRTARVWVSFNGEIYNHADVRRELEPHGHVYRTKSDTETIVHAYEQWGDDCVHRFRGMFAFALWDASKRRLLLVRDRLGVKPLYWTQVGDTLLFASEIKALFASGLVEPVANEAALPEALSTRSIAGSGNAVPRRSEAAARASARVRERRDADPAVLGRADRPTGQRRSADLQVRRDTRPTTSSGNSARSWRNRSGCG